MTLQHGSAAQPPAQLVEVFRTAHQHGDNHGVSAKTALAELEYGKKQSHWIWYVFPQVTALAKSTMSHKYGVDSCEHLRALLNDSEIRGNIVQAYELVARALLSREGSTLDMIFHGDVVKVVSSATLISGYLTQTSHPNCEGLRDAAETILQTARAQGLTCQKTLEFLAMNRVCT